MPEILLKRSDIICDRLEKTWCEECAKSGSTDCTDHGGQLSQDTTVLGKRLGQDAFGDFRQTLEFGGLWGEKSSLKPQNKRANAAPSNPFSSDRASFDRSSFLRSPIPEVVVSPSKPASSSGGSTPPNLVPQSRLEPKKLIKPTPSLPTPIKPSAAVPVSAPAVAIVNTEVVARSNPSTPSDLTREQGPTDPDADENSCKEGGVRFRENLGKYVVEYRPPRFKWKLWMGTYATVEEGRRACDCARFYAGQDKGGFYFKDSPALFEDLGPLNRPFSMVSKDVKDKAFNVELKKRAKQVIRKVLEEQRGKQAVDVTRPTVKKSLPEAIVQQFLSARTNGRSLPGSTPDSLPLSQESRPSSAVVDSAPADSGHEENELAESAQHEVASGVLEAGIPRLDLDHYADLGPLSETSTFGPEFSPDHHNLQGCLHSSLDFSEDFDDFDDFTYVKLWNHDELP